MYLRASDKVSGVENFHSAVGSNLIRRNLVTKALHDGLSPRHGLEAEHFKYGKPKDGPLVVGILGTGQQGLRLLSAINPDYIVVKSVADLRPSNQDRAAEALMSVYKSKGWTTAEEMRKEVAFHASYEELLKSAVHDNLNAVIIALPSHLHAPAALAALEAGLHVFVETPMALTVADAKKVASKAAQKNLILAVGQQRCYNWIYDHALEMVRLNLLDDVHYIRSQWHVLKPENKPAKGESAKKEDKKKAKRPDEFKIDWWQNVPKEEADLKFAGYSNPLELVRWQLYEKYSGGLLAELGSQLFEAAAMFVAATPNRDSERPYPLSVAGSGSQILRDSAGDIDDHVHCVFEYAIQGYVEDKSIPLKARKKIAVQFDLIIGNEFDGYGETVLGKQGSLVLENEQKAMLFHTLDVDKSLRVVEKKDSKGVPTIVVPKDGKADEESEALGRLVLQGADAGFATELEHWAFCCKPPADSKGNSKPLCDAAAGLYTTVLTVAAAKAVKLETRIDFKKEWFDVKSDETPDQL
ncbi:MAG: Gfo/Idh/MocA family oxidoreductase [Planctomycetota bacterium]